METSREITALMWIFVLFIAAAGGLRWVLAALDRPEHDTWRRKRSAADDVQ